MRPTVIIAILLACLATSCTTYREEADGSRRFSTAARMDGNAKVEVNRHGFRMSADSIDHSAGLREARIGITSVAGVATGGGILGQLLSN